MNVVLPLTPDALAEASAKLASARVLIVGDCMLDKYWLGDARRISPEAPVPVVLVEKETLLLGGAGNVARNIRSLGGGARLIALRGNDAAGDEMGRCLAAEQVDHDLVTLEGRPTTVKTRVLARQQQVVRIDSESSKPLDIKDTHHLLEKIEQALPECGAVVVSDYGKGVVNDEFMRGLTSLATTPQRRVPILVDPKPQNVNVYKDVTLLTPNAKETSESAGLPVDSPQDIVRAGRVLMRHLGLEHLVTTLGGRGMAVFQSRDKACHIPTLARQVFDVTGAGDTVIATLAMGLAVGLDLITSSLIANYAAGLVVAEVGAATVSMAELQASIAASELPLIEEWAF